jgi:hypothetical protein
MLALLGALRSFVKASQMHFLKHFFRCKSFELFFLCPTLRRIRSLTFADCQKQPFTSDENRLSVSVG